MKRSTTRTMLLIVGVVALTGLFGFTGVGAAQPTVDFGEIMAAQLVEFTDVFGEEFEAVRYRGPYHD